MNLTFLVLALVAAIVNFAYGAAIALDPAADPGKCLQKYTLSLDERLTRLKDIEDCQDDVNAASATAETYAVGNFSYLFGLQLSGYFNTNEESGAACDDISSIGNNKWAAMGLYPQQIQGQKKSR